MQLFIRFALFVSIIVMAVPFLSAAERPVRLKPKSDASSPAPPQAPLPSQLAVLSIIPAQGEPGARIMVFGSGFGDKVTAFLGTIEIAAKVADGKQAEFSIPATVEPGLYAFYLRRSDGVTGKPYNFTVLPLKPVLNSLSPETVSSCAKGGEREITAHGKNFIEQSMLLFDGAVIRSSFKSSEVITFIAPQVAGGQHQVMVKNPPDLSSVPVAMTLDMRPEISLIRVGDDHVNYYDLIIEGINFNQNSSIYVDGVRIGGRGGQEVMERDRLMFMDCTRLIYQRHPYSPANKEIRIQVVNPGNEGSQVVQVNAP